MFIFMHGTRPATRVLRRKAVPPRRGYAASLNTNFTPPTFPVVERCPAPTCQCREMPQGLEIEREKPLDGTMAAYAEQVLISTGRNDWKSRIEEEEEGVFVRQLKGFLGRGGKYSDPYHNVMLTNSSFSPTESPPHQSEPPHQPRSIDRSTPIAKSGDASSPSTTPPASAFLLPSFQYVPTIATDSPSVEQFIQAFVLPSRLHQSYDRLTRAQQNALKRQPENQSRFVGARKIDEILILICGHNGRDSRCGTLGPILKDEFEEKLQRQNIPLLTDTPVAGAEVIDTEVEGYVPTARVGLMSHIGGHKWAGNVIVYIPPSFKDNALAGKGVWYGRVEPGHVEGIVAKTVLDGKVVKELFRGGIDQSRKILRL